MKNKNFNILVLFVLLLSMSSAPSCNTKSNRIDSFLREQQDSIRKYRELHQENDNVKIFGDFYLGMSQNQFNSILNEIQNTTNGVIRIANTDFRIATDSCIFDKNKNLVSFVIHSKSTMYLETTTSYNPIVGKETLDFISYGWDTMQNVKKFFMNKYGIPTNLEDTTEKSDITWRFVHKNIKIYPYKISGYSSSDFVTAIEYSSPIEDMKKKYIEKKRKEKERLDKEKEQLKKKLLEDSLNRLKESFTKD